MNQPAANEGVRLAVELGTLLLLDSPHASGTFRALLAGMVPGSCVIVTRPAVQYDVGDSVLVRYFHNGSVYAFRSDVRACINHPVKLLLLGYPAEVREQNLRSSPRLECTLPCRVSLAGAEAAPAEGDDEAQAAEHRVEHQGLLRDISREGCQVVLGRSEAAIAETGSAIEVTFWIPLHDEPFTLSGNVRRASSDGQHLEIGVQFDVPAEDAYRQVRSFLEPQSA